MLGSAGKTGIQSIIFFERRPSLNDAILKENKKFRRVENSTFGFKKYSGASKNNPVLKTILPNQNLPKKQIVL